MKYHWLKFSIIFSFIFSLKGDTCILSWNFMVDEKKVSLARIRIGARQDSKPLDRFKPSNEYRWLD